MDYLFRQAKKEDIARLYEIYAGRVRWMDEQGIEGWNTTRYLERYPLAYFEEQCDLGNLYVLIALPTEIIVGGVVLLSEDERWENTEKADAYYIHNFVTHPDFKGCGSIMIDEVEKLGVNKGKDFIRLDCAVSNPVLNSYYAEKGYTDCGYCEDGLYKGILRQKRLIASDCNY